MCISNNDGYVHKDPKRVNFISIQNGHGIACEGYHQAQVRTGYEQLLGSRTSDLFATTALKDGKVVSLTEKGIIFQYEGEEEQLGVELGRRYGNAAGLVIPHEVVTPLKAGAMFKTGDAIAYNTGFFEPDVLNPKQVILKTSTNAKTVLLEAAETLEDSSSISRKLADKLKTKTTKVRTIVVNFDQQLHRLVKAGDQVDYESILCIIEDPVGSTGETLDNETLDTLRVLSAQSPQAKARGVVERVEIYYHGDKEDMSESLQQLSSTSDVLIAQRNQSAARPAYTGSVDENFRIENEGLQLDTAAIQIYITSDISAGVGDKGVFGNQMKSVFGRVFDAEVKTQSGENIDAIFSAVSVDNRIVLSPYLIGTTTTLLNVVAQRMIKAYKS